MSDTLAIEQNVQKEDEDDAQMRESDSGDAEDEGANNLAGIAGQPAKKRRKRSVMVPVEQGPLRVDGQGKVSARKLYQAVWKDPHKREKAERKLHRMGVAKRQELSLERGTRGTSWEVPATKVQKLLEFLMCQRRADAKKELEEFMASEKWRKMHEDSTVHEAAAQDALANSITQCLAAYAALNDVGAFKTAYPNYSHVVDAVANTLPFADDTVSDE